MKAGDKRLVINYKHQLLIFFIDLVFFSCIYVTKLAEFLHGVAFVFLEERCYSIEDIKFFCFVRCPEIGRKYMQKFENGLILFEDLTQQIVFISYVLKLCF